MKSKRLPIFPAIVLLAAAGCHAGVNRTLRVDDGAETSRGLHTVNGSIRIGRDADVGGSSRSVNGNISVRDGSRVRSLATVNGSIEVAANVAVDGDLESVNGSVESGAGTEVSGDVATINGSLRLEGTLVQGKVRTHNGSVTLLDGSRIRQDVVIERSRGDGARRRLKIKIRDGAVVEGDVIVKDRDRPVTVYLSAGGEVLGEIRGAEVVREAPAA